MPSKKGQRMASRQGQLSRRSRRRPSNAQLSKAQLQGPVEAAGQLAGPTPAPESGSHRPEGSAIVPGPSTAPSAMAPLSPRARRERQAVAIQTGPSMRSELLRIGIVAFVVTSMLVVLKFATEMGG